jgi:hypothetical protein
MDKISGALQTALGGIESNLRRLDAAAQKVATTTARNDSPTELADPLVDALAARRSLEASAVVMKRADDLLGSLLAALR